jgi:hypothetical protein
MITDFEIVDLGVHHPDYFQGFGTSFTKFEHSTYGIGYTAQAAYDDALDQMASGSTCDGMPSQCPFSGSVEPNPCRDDDNTTSYYHVGVRWNAPARDDSDVQQLRAEDRNPAHADRETQHGRYLDAGHGAWDDTGREAFDQPDPADSD